MGNRVVRFRRRPTVFVFVLVALPLAACSSTTRELGRSAFVKLVNVKCKAEKEKLAFAAEVADQLGLDDRAKATAKRVSDATERFRGEIRKLHGPKQLQDEIDAISAAAKQIPGRVAQGTITPEEAKAQLRGLQDRLESAGLGECVHG